MTSIPMNKPEKTNLQLKVDLDDLTFIMITEDKIRLGTGTIHIDIGSHVWKGEFKNKVINLLKTELDNDLLKIATISKREG